MRALLATVLRRQGHQVVEAADGVELLQQLTETVSGFDSQDFDLVISDIKLPRLSALEVFEGLRRGKNSRPTILITAFGDEEVHERAQALGAPVFDKPFEIPCLLEKVHELLTA
jgi:CheY-like chemotaxis protein